MLRTVSGALVLALTFAPTASGQHKLMDEEAMTQRGVQVENPWARASGGQSGAAYFDVRNGGKRPDRLIGASTPVARRAEFHTHLMEGNVMRMRRIEDLKIAPGASVTFRPGGNHVMLTGLKRKLVKGQSFPLTLRFERAGEVTVSVRANAIAATGPSDGMKLDRGGHMH